jgi:transcriptional regulator with XRE-family HTH domain
MPATSPAIGDTVRTKLTALGSHLRARRKALRVSATVAAEAAGISRVTWHRIERGEPSVTMGAYLNAISALGLDLSTTESGLRPADSGIPGTDTETVRLADYPQLRRIAWQLGEFTELTPQEALALYERNWRHVDQSAMDARERDLVTHLVDTWGKGTLLV